MTGERRIRFRAAAKSLRPDAPWGVYDELSRVWAIEPREDKHYSRCAAEARAAAMEGARR